MIDDASLRTNAVSPACATIAWKVRALRGPHQRVTFMPILRFETAASSGLRSLTNTMSGVGNMRWVGWCILAER
jgi:hypothetical protein